MADDRQDQLRRAKYCDLPMTTAGRAAEDLDGCSAVRSSGAAGISIAVRATPIVSATPDTRDLRIKIADATVFS